MKKTFIYSLLLVFISCNQTHNDKVEPFDNAHVIKQETKTTSTVSNYTSGSESRMTYTLTQNTDEGNCVFNSYCFFKTEPLAEIGMGLHFERSGAQIKDTLITQSFSKFMDLNNVKKIQIDSMTYKVIDDKIKLRFICTLFRGAKDKLKITDKYTMVYSSGFIEPKPTMIVDKIEKSFIEIIGDTY